MLDIIYIFWYHLDTYNEELNFFGTSKVWMVFVFLIPFGFDIMQEL